MVIVDVFPVVLFAEKAAVKPVGIFGTESVTLPVNPFRLMVTTAGPFAPAAIDVAVGATDNV